MEIASIIAKVPQLVPVEKAMKLETKKTKGAINIGDSCSGNKELTYIPVSNPFELHIRPTANASTISDATGKISPAPETTT